MIGFLGLTFLASVVAIPQAYHKTGDVDWRQALDGSWPALYEEKYDQTLAHHKLSTNVWGTARYAMFGEGREGVLAGREGWLFTTEEFVRPENFDQNIAHNFDFIRGARDALAEKRTKLLVVPLPAKARVYQEFLERYRYPSYWQGQYARFLEFLNAEDIAAIDLATLYQKSKDQPLYLKTDTHWTPLGARMAALAAASSASVRWPYWAYETQEFSTRVTGKAEHQGDLMRYISTGKSVEKLGLLADLVSRVETHAGSEDYGAGLFDDVSIPITLVGTSYSAHALWNFDGFLKEAFQADVLNVADEGLGPFAVMQNYLSSKALETHPPKLVIWEIPERYLPVSFEPEL